LGSTVCSRPILEAPKANVFKVFPLLCVPVRIIQTVYRVNERHTSVNNFYSGCLKWLSSVLWLKCMVDC